MTNAAITKISEAVELPFDPDARTTACEADGVDGAADGVRVITGAGKSGSGWPGTGTSIHRTISPDE